MKSLILAAVLMVSGGGLLLVAEADINLPSPSNAEDILDEYYINNRISTVITLEEFKQKDMDVKDPDSLSWLVSTLKEKSDEDRSKVDKYIGEKIGSGEISQVIEDIKTKKLGRDLLDGEDNE